MSHCSTCTCDRAFIVNIDAPFYPLVEEIDHIWNDHRRFRHDDIEPVADEVPA